MCLKNRMTDAEGQRLLDLLHLLKNDNGLLDTVRRPTTSLRDAAHVTALLRSRCHRGSLVPLTSALESGLSG